MRNCTASAEEFLLALAGAEVKLSIADAALEGDFGRDVGATLGVLFQLAGNRLRLRARRGPGGLLPIREKAPHEPQHPDQGEQRQTRVSRYISIRTGRWYRSAAGQSTAATLAQEES